MPTLIQINSALNRGSTGRIAEQIGLLAQSKGWQSIIACGSPRNQNKSALPVIQCVTRLEERCNALQTRLFDNHGLAGTYATLRLVKQIDEIKPDIIHLHNIHGYHINYKVLFEYLQTIDCKVVWTLHDCWPFTGHCTYFDRVECNKWMNLCYNCIQKGEYPASLFLDNSSSNFRTKKELFTSLGNRLTLVPVSEWLASLIRKSFLKDFRINCIHNGIDISSFQPVHREEAIKTVAKYSISKNTIEGKYIILGCVSGWDERKGYSDFIKLRHLLSDKFVVIMVGCNNKQIKEVDSHNIIAVNKTESQRELAAFYSIADVFANPTYEDNFPTTNLESLACGTPVITYRTGGSPEAIDDKTGVIIEKGDIYSLAKSCEELCEKSSNMSENCRKRAENLYNKDNRFEEYISLYNWLLESK